MKRDLFGTDGVRGLADEYPLDSAGSYKIGMAVGAHFAQPGQRVVIGYDTRESSVRIVQDLTKGLMATGVHVTSVGVLPTPGLAFLTREAPDFVAGIMITASHNPYQYNGIKVFDGPGGKLSDATEATLNSLIDDGVAERGPAGMSVTDTSLVQQYEDFLVAGAEGLTFPGLKVAIDSANGAASGLSARVFTRLGATVTSLYDQPDGKNINESCGATDTRALQAAVKTGGLNCGIALDGDSDRLIMVDEHGREARGDYLLYILAVANHLDGVVATVMSNLGFEQALQRHDIALERTDVGDRYVLEGLTRTGYELGGEQSGHIIIPSMLATGDALLAAIQVVRSVAESGKSLAEWCDEVVPVPQALVNISLADKARLDQPAVKAFVAEQTKELGDSGRLLIRPSGTEPLARVMVEAPDAETRAQSIAAKLQELLA